MKTTLAIILFSIGCLPVFADSTGKAWVDDWAAYLNDHPQQLLIRGQSQRDCLTPAEAETAALRDAVAQLGLPLDSPIKVEALLQPTGAVQDRYVAKFERPYGTIWQAWVLVDRSPKKLAGLRESVTKQTVAAVRRAQHHHLLRLGWVTASGVGLLALYFAANSATRGYFTWRLRLVTLLAMLLAAGGINRFV